MTVHRPGRLETAVAHKINKVAFFLKAMDARLAAYRQARAQEKAIKEYLEEEARAE